MTGLERDLLRWETGELTLEEVEAAHPEVGIRELVRVHTRLSMLRAIPMPDVERAWSMTVTQLGKQPVPLMERMRGWARKPLIASFASVVMTGGAAYAAGVDPVERAVDSAWAGLSRVVHRESPEERDVASDEESESTDVTATETAPVVGSTEPPGDDADGEHGKSKTKGKSEEHRKDEANKHRGWVNKTDHENKKGKEEKPETPAAGAEPPGHADGSGPPTSAGSGSKDKGKPSAHTEAADDAGADAAPIEAEPPPAPPAPPANSNAGGNDKATGKDKLRL